MDDTVDTTKSKTTVFFDEKPYEPRASTSSRTLENGANAESFTIDLVQRLINCKKTMEEAKEAEEIRAFEKHKAAAAVSMTNNTDIKVVRKFDVFSSEVTDDEQEIIKQRVAAQQKRFQEFEERQAARRLRKVKELFPLMTDKESTLALCRCSQNEEETVAKLTDPHFMKELRQEIAKLAMKANGYVRRKVVRKRVVKRPRDPKSDYEYRRLRLDDALAQGNFDGWSPARKKAFECRLVNPNSYYYRFNDPGEAQRNGKWSTEEKALFYRRWKSVGVDGNWGVFSTAIPGRVGYQCSNFYRELIKSGEVTDPNYTLDEKGKVHYVFKYANGKKGSISRPRKDKQHPLAATESAGRGAASGNLPPDAAVKAANAAATESPGGVARHINLDHPVVTPSPPTATTVTVDVDATTRQLPPKKEQPKKRRAPAKKRAAPGESSTKKRRTTKRRRKADDYDDDDDGEGYVPFASWQSRTSESSRRGGLRGASSSSDPADGDASSSTDTANGSPESKGNGRTLRSGENPLPGLLDPITLDEVERPAISPFGHVMGWTSWKQCLSNVPPNVCPLTKKSLMMRELVLLTTENIEHHRASIVNT